MVGACLIGKFSELGPKKVLVAGDLLLDSYTIGKAHRISPEAPVAIIHVQSSEERPGGAGNTILNLVSMGAEVTALGRIGNTSGNTLLESLRKENVNVQGIFTEEGYSTPVKNRIVADNQQIIRVDHEVNTPINGELESKIIEQLPALLHGISVVAISDYGKGFLSPRLLKALITTAKSLKIFIIADPKGIDFTPYSGVDLIKPNFSEACIAAHLPKTAPLEAIASAIIDSTDISYLIITRSEHGISLFDKESKRTDFPVKAKQVKDVTGAGDTVLATLALAIANNLSLETAIEFANVAAGIAIEEFGCARITLAKLAKRLLEIDAANKVFDSEHMIALQAALADTPCLFLELKDVLPTPEMICTLMQEKKGSGKAVMVSLKTPPFQEAAISMLAQLHTIDYILLNTSQETIRRYFPAIQKI
jgi:rfaE bifunctional protein kinase chain/domain